MEVLIADSWIMSTSRLDAAEHKRAWEFYARFKENPAHPSLSLERVAQAKDKQHTWSGRISQGLRAILYQDGELRAVLYAGRHDDAYDWARTHTLERHTVTGTLQLVEAPETVAFTQPVVPAPRAGLFDAHRDDYLVSLGLPPTWLPVIRAVVDEEQLLEVVEKLPEDVQIRFLDLAEGKLVTPPVPVAPDRPPLESADAQRHFYVLAQDEDLQRILAAPLASWVVFLHPSQKRLAYGTLRGPLKITGSAGTGKTVVALHRAKHLAAQGKRVLLTSFVKDLCENLESALGLLCTPEERGRITAGTVHSRALALVRLVDSRVHPMGENDVRPLLEARAQPGLPLDSDGLVAEWEGVIQAQGITSWEAYRGASRAGRGTPLNIRDRKAIWEVMAAVQADLARKGACTYTDLCRRARELVTAGQVANPYDAVIVDEAQDLGPQELLLLAALGGNGPDGLTLVGDGGQRIYRQATSLRSLGIDVRGRSHVLRINYRTTEQIRRFAERIIRHQADDLDEGRDDRRGVRNLLRGPEPTLRGFATSDEQFAAIVTEIGRLIEQGLQPSEIAAFARKRELARQLGNALHRAGISSRSLGAKGGAPGVTLGTMHGAKGLEFKAVFVIDVSDEYLPLPKAYRDIQDPHGREEALRQERQLLYVSLTRARDEVHVTWVGEKSRFLKKE